MRDTTKTILEQLAAAAWFSQVGQQNVKDAIVVSSWAEALGRCSSPEWEDFTLEAQNQITMSLSDCCRARYQEWNNIVRKVKIIAIPMVNEKTKPAVEQHKLPEGFVTQVHWDIVGIAMEAEYSDVVEPGLYPQLAKWYLAGRFPCGWQGEFPEGKMIIF